MHFGKIGGTINTMITKLLEAPSLWETLSQCQKPIVLYGMGDGADKLLTACSRFDIPIAGVFASDNFVRGQQFHQWQVKTMAALEAELGDFVVLLAFATSRPQVLAQVDAVAKRHTLYAPDLPVCGDILFTRQYLQNRQQDAQRVYQLLADEPSRQVYLDILRYKLSGDIQYLYRCHSPKETVWTELLSPTQAEFFVDCGAYTGDTVEEFLVQCSGEYAGILALEPDRRNFKKLLQTVSTLDPKKVSCHNLGVWSHQDTLLFAHKSGRQAALSTQGIPTPVNSIDNLLDGRAATLIKYDVEGAETQALLGSRNTIQNHSPRLVVSAYHRSEDLFDLPLLIHQLNPSYRLYLRHHPYIPAWDTNLYAIP